MNSTQGTPKTIDEAIENALNATEILRMNTIIRSNFDANELELGIKNTIKTHVRDFISQKAFSKDQIAAYHYRQLFYKIFNLKEGDL